MQKFKKLAFLLVILSSFFMTGCDAESIAQVINDVAQAVQQAVPAVQSIIDAFSGITSPNSGSNFPTSSQPSSPTCPEVSAPSSTGVSIPSPSSEDLSIGGQGSSPTDSTPSSTSGSVEQLKAEMRSKHGVNAIDSSARWSREELIAALRVLDTLPDNFKRHTQNIKRERLISNHPHILGSVVMGIPTVNIADAALESRSLWEGTLVHEMVHTFQANNRQIRQRWAQQFWSGSRPRSASVSSYGNTDPDEDMAESVRAYWQSGSRMKRSHPDRYEFVKRYVMDGKEF